MGQGGSSVACTSIEEQDYLLEMPQRYVSHGHNGHLVLQGKEEQDLTLRIPNECVECILQKLEPGDRIQCSLVCRRWHELEGRSRTQLSLVANADLMPFLPRIFARFVQVCKITLKCDRKEASIDDRALVLIGKHCRNLVKLKLKGCRDISDEGLDHFSRVSHALKKFSCGSCGFGPLGLNCLLQRCPELESLAVKRLRGLSQAFPELIGPGCGKIRKLCLKELRNARLFGPLIVGSKNLQCLRLSKNLGHWDKLLEAIMEHLPNLLELHIERLQLSDRGLQAVAQCKTLEALYVVKASECTNFGLSAIAFGCRKLKRLRIDGWRNGRIGDEGLISIAKRCRELQELVLIRLSISVGSLSLLGSNCTSLERLAICNCASFGDVELACVAAKCRSLRKLCIRGCPVSDLGVEGIASVCPALSRLKIRNCNGVSAEGIANLKMRLGRPLWISLINDVSPGELEEVNAGTAARAAAAAALQASNNSNRIQRVLHGSSQLMKSKLNWDAAAVSCYCVKS